LPVFLKAALMPDVVNLRPHLPPPRCPAPLPQRNFGDGPPAVPARGRSWARRLIAGAQRALALRSLDDHLLRDIGLTRQDVEPPLMSIMAANRRLWQL
jgi:uncharacterized protein YjiS (DUF1127 family)